MAAITTASAQTPPDNEIWYTTTDGSKQGIYCEGEEFASDWRMSVGSYFTHTYNETNNVWVLKFYEVEKLSIFPNIDLTLFGRNDKVNSVIMPDCIEEITGLSGQTALRSIELPTNLKIIGRDAFKDCRYIKIGNKPIFNIFSPFEIPDTNITTRNIHILINKTQIAIFYL